MIRSVRHHHERVDGSGYPDGLMGVVIPLGARIIAVCDAVDAMLSDRPYRSALTVPVVLQQLSEHAGRQFDPTIVDAVLKSDILTDYADTMRLQRAAERDTRHPFVAPLVSRAPRRLFRTGVARAIAE